MAAAKDRIITLRQTLSLEERIRVVGEALEWVCCRGGRWSAGVERQSCLQVDPSCGQGQLDRRPAS